MNKINITVFGATGNIGKELLTLLSNAKVHTIAVTRDKSKAIEMPFVSWIEADMSDKNSLANTMLDSNAVFLLSGVTKNFIEEQNNVINVAKELSVKHIVKLSSGAADHNSAFLIPKVHGEVEELLKLSGVTWTMLRPYGIMQNWLGDTAETVKKERKIYEATGDGKRAHVDRRDIAEVAFKVLTEPEKHQNKEYTLTSDNAVNYKQIANAISKEINSSVEFIPLTIDEAKQQMEQAGMPQFLIDTFISYDTAQLNGLTEIVTNNVKTILGKPARTVENFAKDYAELFR